MTKRDQSARQIILPPTAGTGAEELTEKQKLQAVSLWQEEQLKALSQPAKTKHLEMVSHLPPTESWGNITQLPMLNYQPDRAVKAAIIAQQDWKEWKRKQGERETTYWAYRFPMSPGHNLHVYLGGLRPPLGEEARNIVEQFRVSMALHAKICLSIWLQRRRDEHLSSTGSALIHLDEILAIRGMKKSHTAKVASSNVSYSSGYRWADRQAIIEDMVLLQQLYLKGKCVINVDGEWQPLIIEDDPYLHFSLLTKENEQGDEKRIGIFVTPGNWFNLYEARKATYVAEVERAVFKLNPQQDYHELLIGFALTERWRDLAKKQDYARPITMQGLLEASVITFDRKNPSRFIRRIKDALDGLYERGIIGAPVKSLDAVNQSKLRWTGDWLAQRVILVPPESIVEHYHQSIIISPQIIDAAPASRQRTRTAKKR